MKLSNIQRRLLASAAARHDGHLFPLVGAIADKQLEKACQGLLALELVAALPTKSDQHIWRLEGDAKLALIITPHARNIIAAEQDGVSLANLPSPEANEAAQDAPSRSKTGQVQALLRREGGVSLDELGKATGWLPHSVRAALTGLRKKGHPIERVRRDDVTVYFVKQEC